MKTLLIFLRFNVYFLLTIYNKREVFKGTEIKMKIFLPLLKPSMISIVNRQQKVDIIY